MTIVDTIDDDIPSLGPCCICESAEDVTNVLMFDRRANLARPRKVD